MDIVFIYNSSIIDSVKKMNTIKYQLRSIATYAPEIEHIFFIVKDKTEFESLYTNISFIECKDIIPDYALNYADNINVVDLYITNIPNLSENFIYVRENWFILRHNTYYTNNYPILSFCIKSDNDLNKLAEGCYWSNAICFDYLVSNELTNIKKFGADINGIPMCKSMPTPLLKSKCSNFIQYYQQNLQEENIQNNINITSNKYDNLNYLVYTDYFFYTEQFIPETLSFKFLKMNFNINSIINNLNNISTNTKFLTLENIDKIKTLEEFEEKKILINNWLEQRFPDKCKYEI